MLVVNIDNVTFVIFVCEMLEICVVFRSASLWINYQNVVIRAPDLRNFIKEGMNIFNNFIKRRHIY